MTNLQTKIKLADGQMMPLQGLGLYKVTDQDEMDQVVETAWQQGYRLFDTAQLYQNEGNVGQAIKDVGMARSDVFVTTKVAEENQGYDATLRSVEVSLTALQMDYVDLLMVHWPIHQHFFATWQALERLKAEGLVKSLGVSNFDMVQLQYLATQANEMPVVNQIENHPHLSQVALRRFHNEQQIVTQAWAPLGRGTVLAEPVITTLAERYHKSPAQIVLRWHVQNGVSIIPKSSKATRVLENGDIYDFALSDEEIRLIDALNTFQRLGREPAQVYEYGSQYPR